jgi:hypothetical protein
LTHGDLLFGVGLVAVNFLRGRKQRRKIEDLSPRSVNNTIMKPTSEQRFILENTTSSLRILAAAGSGKTTTMAQKVKDEIDSGRCKPEEICFTTFTRFAADQIRQRVAKVIGHEVDILCGTFHSIIYKLRARAGLHGSKPDNLYSARMEVWVEEFMTFLRDQHPKLLKILRGFKVLIVDEFQDLDDTQFNFVKLFKQIQPTLRVLAIGDLAQNIYRFRGTSNEFLNTRLQKEVCPDLNTYKLTTNFRSTRAILNAVNTIFRSDIAEQQILPMIPGPNAAEGKKPTYYEFAINPGKGIGEYEELVANTLFPMLVRAKAERKSIVLIFPIIKCQSFQLIMALLRQKSKQAGFKLDLHQIAKEDETCSTVSFAYDTQDPKSPVQFSSIHSSKGLEWDIVALIDMSDYIYELRGAEDCEAFYAEKTNLTYVAFTRAAEELHIFANANGGGRHRKLAELGDKIGEAFDVVTWGETAKEWEAQQRKPIAVTELVRKLPQHADLFERIRACSEHIGSVGMDGFPMQMENVYSEMKTRNRELAFGTYMDWKLKRMLCGSQTIQDVILELMSCYANGKYFYKVDAYDDLSLRLAKLDLYFMNAEKEPVAPLEQYVIASRYMGLSSSRYYGFIDSIRAIYRDVERIILKSAAAKEPSFKDEYIISQLKNFYVRGATSEITAFDAPADTYMGMPEHLEAFVVENVERGAETLRACMRDTGATGKFRGDVCLESASLIMGEADIVSENGVLMEIKCGTARKAVDMRDTGNCKHLLQVLAYVALARHGTIPVKLERACIVNPLTGAWERYDLSSWTMEQSLEFMACLEELRERG